MGKPDVVFECHEAITSYRLSPNPDAEAGDGYRHGALLTLRDDGAGGDSAWRSSFFIAPEAMQALGLALLEASRDVSESTQ